MEITPIPCLTDNYAYVVRDTETGAAVVIDPSEHGPVLAALDAIRCRGPLHVEAILATHHHPDHVGGIDTIVRTAGVRRVIAHRSDIGRVPGQTEAVDDGDTVQIGALAFYCLHVPGHTLGAVAYLARHGVATPAVFTGDTLFLGGCGRLFEGDAAMLYRSLRRLADLEGETEVYCGHEYTVANLRFALSLGPDELVASAIGAAVAKRDAGRPTVPGTMDGERRTNPFLSGLRWRASLGLREGAGGVEVFAAMRAAKDRFRG